MRSPFAVRLERVLSMSNPTTVFSDVMTRTPEIGAGLPRMVEAVVSLAALLGSLPILALAAAAIAATSRGSVLFRQKRVGRGGRNFVLYKLRTMHVTQIGPQVTSGDDDRVTRVGKFLRKTKLDELPQLWNVLRGDMSLVGPRPEVPRYVDLANPMWRMVLKAKPGVTDPVTLRLRNEEELLTQVRGDREGFYLETLQPFKLEGYTEYLRIRNWKTDIKVLLSSGMAVVFRSRTTTPTLKEISAYAMTSPQHK